MGRIGIYGGAFNPPHTGHIRAAEYAIQALQLEKLLLIPSCTSPHKPLPAGSPVPEQRLEMVRLVLFIWQRIIPWVLPGKMAFVC